MNNDKLRQLYEQGVKQYKVLEFEAQDNLNWAQTSASGTGYRKQHFDWFKELLNAMKTESKAAYSASKIIKQIKFESNPDDYWLNDNPDSLTCASIYSDTGIILSELEKYLDSVPGSSRPDLPKTTLQKITYDKHAKQINFKGYEPLSLRNTEHQALLCEVLFKSKRPITSDVMLEKWGWHHERIYDDLKLKESNRLVMYHAARDLNEKINKHTNHSVNDLILFTTKSTQINPDYSKFVS